MIHSFIQQILSSAYYVPDTILFLGCIIKLDCMLLSLQSSIIRPYNCSRIINVKCFINSQLKTKTKLLSHQPYLLSKRLICILMFIPVFVIYQTNYCICVLDFVLGMGYGVHLWINSSKSLSTHSLCANEREVVNFIIVNDGSTVEKIRAVWKWDARNGYGLAI